MSWRSSGPDRSQRMPTGSLLRATPRTGSTLACSLLASTIVLGAPESYFRVEDEEAWADRLGVHVAGGRARDHRAFVMAVRAAGSTANGVFAARVMWGSVERVVEGLAPPAGQPDAVTLQGAFGPLAFVHLTRADVIAQAVSWARAEQTGYWQVHHQPRPAPPLSYEAVTRDPAGAIAEIASHGGVVLPEAWRPESPHRKQADQTNAEWSALLRARLDRRGETDDSELAPR